MEARRSRIKGIVLAEVIIAVLMLTIFATGLMAAFFMQNKLLYTIGHKAHAVNYAVSAAEKLFGLTKNIEWYYPGAIPELTSGLHTKDTDPTICGLPDNHFTEILKGKLEYTVTDDIVLSNETTAVKVTITVSWEEETTPDGEREEESLVIAPIFVDSYYYY